jgi:hypothetical protein
VHDVEAFGPVATLLPYDSAAEVVELMALGQGSLVGSVVSHDPAFVRDVVLGAAGHHGRLHVLDRDSAKESTGHGSPLPHLVHGGPGRAGGGEELGGMRGVRHFLQRTAVQGSPDMLTAITGVYTPGAARVETEEHPFRKPMSRLRVGDTSSASSGSSPTEDVAHFADFTGDRFYAHTDPVAAAANPLFGGIVAHGYLVLSLAAGLFVDPAPGPVLANTGLDRLRFTKPVAPGAEHPRGADLRVEDPAHARAGRGAVGRAGARPGRRAGRDLRAADDGERLSRLCGVTGHHVAAGVLQERVEQAVGELGDPRGQGVHALHAERPGDELALAGVRGRVDGDHRRRLQRVDQARVVVREQLPLQPRPRSGGGSVPRGGCRGTARWPRRSR